MLDVKIYMKGNHNEYNCDEGKILGILNEDTQCHLLKCPVINIGKYEKDSEYSEIFADVDKNIQINVTK